MDSYVDGGVRYQIQAIVGYRTKKFADIARAMGYHLFRDHFSATGPHTIGMRVPENFHCLIQIDLPEFRFIDKCANTDVTHVGHLGEQITLLHEISLMYGQ